MDSVLQDRNEFRSTGNGMNSVLLANSGEVRLMNWRNLSALFAVLILTTPSLRAQDINDELEKAAKAAVKKVAPSVVQIVTVGGTDIVVTGSKGATFRKALGPTT